MAQGPMEHDRISNVDKALSEHKELTREQFRELFRHIDSDAARRDREAVEQRAAIAEERQRSDALHAEGRRRFDESMARIDRKFDRLTALVLTSWLSTMGTLLYLHFH